MPLKTYLRFACLYLLLADSDERNLRVIGAYAWRKSAKVAQAHHPGSRIVNVQRAVPEWLAQLNKQNNSEYGLWESRSGFPIKRETLRVFAERVAGFLTEHFDGIPMASADAEKILCSYHFVERVYKMSANLLPERELYGICEEIIRTPFAYLRLTQK